MSPQVVDALLAFAHFSALLIMASFIGAEAMLLRGQAGAATLRALARSDIGYFISAIAVLASGLARLFFGAKGVAFYSGNPLLYVKLALFAAIGILSIRPTLQFIRWRKAVDADASFMPAPNDIAAVRRTVFIELHLIAFIPLAAVFMARGIGH